MRETMVRLDGAESGGRSMPLPRQRARQPAGQGQPGQATDGWRPAPVAYALARKHAVKVAFGTDILFSGTTEIAERTPGSRSSAGIPGGAADRDWQTTAPRPSFLPSEHQRIANRSGSSPRARSPTCCWSMATRRRTCRSSSVPSRASSSSRRTAASTRTCCPERHLRSPCVRVCSFVPVHGGAGRHCAAADGGRIARQRPLTSSTWGLESDVEQEPSTSPSSATTYSLPSADLAGFGAPASPFATG